MLNVKLIRHYTELINTELDKFEEAYDDEMPDIGTEIENLISDLALSYDNE